MDTTIAVGASLEATNTQNQRYLYVVFSSTPYKMGQFIRFVTHSRYNHVAVSLDPSLATLYSFARHYRNTPFYGGFVRETATRYSYRGRLADIKVCAVPVSEAQYASALRMLESMIRSSHRYSYNMLSAIAAPLHRRVHLPNAYTCIEFAVDFLAQAGVLKQIDPKHSYTIKELENCFNSYQIYSGVFNGTPAQKRDTFENKQDLITATALTVVENAKLVDRLLHRGCANAKAKKE